MKGHIVRVKVLAVPKTQIDAGCFWLLGGAVA